VNSRSLQDRHRVLYNRLSCNDSLRADVTT
jgi:hypothetical protein